MSCTPDAVVCDDTPATAADPFLLLAQGALLLLVLLVVVLLVARLVRVRRLKRAPVTRVWVSADGDVVRRA